MLRTTALLGLGLTILLGGCPFLPVPGDSNLPARITLVVEATGPAQLAAGEGATLTARVVDADPAATYTFAWLQTAGPGAALIDANQSTAGLVAPSLPATGVLRYLVTVSDGGNGVGSAEVVLAVQADPNYGQDDDDDTIPAPVARLDESVTAAAGATVAMDGSRSTGLGLSYSWFQMSGETVVMTGATTAICTITAPAYVPGGENELSFELIVTDVRGRRSRATITVIVVEADDIDAAKPRVRIRTTLGSFVVELEPEQAPRTVENFLQYVDDGFYVGLIFHRVMPNFVVQGGGFLPGLTPKETRDPIPLEADNGLRNDRATLAMARTNDPNSATSQFYVNLKNNDELNPDLNPPGYTVFGRVVEGMSVIDAIAAVETETVGSFQDVPVTDIVILDARRVTTTPNDSKTPN